VAATSKKTPSPKVIASYALQQAIRNVHAATPEFLSEMVSSRVSPEKKDKVLAQVTTVSKKFVERLERTIQKFEGEPEAKPKTKKGKEAPVPKKKVKKA